MNLQKQIEDNDRIQHSDTYLDLFTILEWVIVYFFGVSLLMFMYYFSIYVKKIDRRTD